MELSGRVALIVGGKRIGAFVTEQLAKHHVHLAVAYRHSRSEADTQVATARKHGVRAIVLQGDITIEKEVQQLLQGCLTEFGQLDFVINLASTFTRATLETLDAVAWDEQMDITRGAYLLAMEAVRIMSRNQGPTRGHLVMFSDWAAGETPYLHYLPYLVSKGALNSLVRVLAKEVASQGILVNAIAPGPTLRPSDMSPEEWDSLVTSHTPLHRAVRPEDIATLILGLLQTETVTGEIIRVDSGRHLAGTQL